MTDTATPLSTARLPENAPLPASQPSPETLALLAQRRSAKWLMIKEPGPSPKQVEDLLAIASRVPDHGKLAPWRFIVIEGDGRRQLGERAAALYQAREPKCPPERLELERKRFANVPVTVCVVSRTIAPHKIPVWEQQLSAGAVCMNLLIAAQAMGFAGSWITEWITFDSNALQLLGVKPGERLAGMVGLGSADTLSERPRPVVAALTTRWQAP